MADVPRGAGPGADPWSDRLSEYLDGGMRRSDREALDAHLAGCAACASALAELREVVARARSLEDAPPPVDLWPAIEARLEPRARATRAGRGVSVETGAWWGRRFELGLPQLAAAAVLLVALTAGGAWLALRGPALPGLPGARPGGTDPVAGDGPTRGKTTPSTGRAPAAAPAGLPDPRYEAAVAELERALEAGQDRLDPRTLRVLEENLRIIDRAIEDSRRAVAADPGNAWLRSHLAATKMRKFELLRSATLLAAGQT